jgi:hypothetical protein
MICRLFHRRYHARNYIGILPTCLWTCLKCGRMSVRPGH